MHTNIILISPTLILYLLNRGRASLACCIEVLLLKDYACRAHSGQNSKARAIIEKITIQDWKCFLLGVFKKTLYILSIWVGSGWWE